jgi:hypothetical protein
MQSGAERGWVGGERWRSEWGGEVQLCFDLARQEIRARGHLPGGGGSDDGQRCRLQQVRRGRNAGLARALKKSLKWALGHIQPDRTVEVGQTDSNIHFGEVEDKVKRKNFHFGSKFKFPTEFELKI